MEKTLLIIGIDPGTTTAYALMDLDGKLVSVNSGKQYSLPILISETIAKGTIIIAASDKHILPDFVQKYATKVGARTIAPDEDLLVLEKKALTQLYRMNIHNNHEMDALASAVYALKHIAPLLQRIDSVIREDNKEHMKSQVQKLVLTRQMGIRTAIEYIEQPEAPDAAAIKEVIERRITDQDFFTLYEEMKKQRKENDLLKKQNTGLANEIAKNRSLSEYLRKKIEKILPDDKAKQMIDQKERRLKAAYMDAAKKDEEIERLKKEIRKLHDYFFGMDQYVFVKKLANLAQAEFLLKNKKLKIKENDILLIDNPNIYSETVISELKGKIYFIISKTPVIEKTKTLGFVFLDATHIGLIETDFFALADKTDLEREKKSADVLDRIVEEYRKERSR